MQEAGRSQLTGLLGLAGELEKEGQYNAGKLVRGAALALVNRWTFEETEPISQEDFADALQRMADQLGDSPAAGFVDPIRAAASAIASGGVPLVTDAPDPFVCRVCGHVELGAFETRCPTCGRWPWTAERVRPIYWMRESTPPEAIARLRRTPQEIAELLDGPDPEQMHAPGADGGWSAHRTLRHLHDAQSVFRGRIEQLLEGGEPTLESVMVWTLDGDQIETAQLFTAYRELRTEIVQLLESAPVSAWWNIGFHEEWGRVTLGEQASYFANHEPTHLAQLADAIG